MENERVIAGYTGKELFAEANKRFIELPLKSDECVFFASFGELLDLLSLPLECVEFFRRNDQCFAYVEMGERGKVTICSPVLNKCNRPIVNVVEMKDRINKAATVQKEDKGTTTDEFLSTLTDLYIGKGEVIEIECADDFIALFGRAKYEVVKELWERGDSVYYIGKKDGKYFISYSTYREMSGGARYDYDTISVSDVIKRQVGIYMIRDNDSKLNK